MAGTIIMPLFGLLEDYLHPQKAGKIARTVSPEPWKTEAGENCLSLFKINKHTFFTPPNHLIELTATVI